MGSESRFVYNPSSVDIGRSKFLMNSYWKGDIYHGDLVPLEITRVMPGDSCKYDLSLFIRTGTPPIFPIMDNIKFYVRAFYVPERLVWSKEKEFLGENTEGYGIQTEVLAPRTTNDSTTVYKDFAGGAYKQSIATYLGLVRQVSSISGDVTPIALNPIRSFLQVYNDWFRNENFMAPYLWDHGQTGDAVRVIATRGGSNVQGYSNLPKVCKNLDRFTSCLPWAQKGSPVPVPVLGEAPVVAANSGHFMKNDLIFGYKASPSDTNPTYPTTNIGSGSGAHIVGTNSDGHLSYYVQPDSLATNYGDYSIQNSIQYSNLVADLSQATGATVNQLRLAFATQKYLEQLARSGSKYREYIRAMFGVTIGDTTAQMAEYLGGMCVDINIDQVLQTTNYAAGSTTLLGAPGASSTSAASDYLFTKSFDEPGFIVIVGYAKHSRTYGQGIDDIYLKHEVLEEYNPKFANIGEQALKKDLIYFSGKASDSDTRLGFQEAWSEYRYKRDMVVGGLAPSNSSSFNFTNLAENFASAPTLNEDFLTEDRTNIARCLAGGASSPDYFVDIKFNRTFIRPMPLYSIPGLIDHH